ncbi:MAG: hypothetical protein MJK04_23840 [Psychrosphaera sp.]|nr:hypothetical protein [Psychrosphaera sp.]
MKKIQEKTASSLWYTDGHEAATQAGKFTWDHLNRVNGNEQTNTRMMGAVGVFGSLMTAGVNLALGGRNMKRKSSDVHCLSVTVNNFTPFSIIISKLSKVDGASIKTSAIAPDDSGDIELGTRSYSGEANKDNGPSIHMVLSNGTEHTALEVKFMDSSTDSYSGQIRIRKVSADGVTAEDLSGVKSSVSMTNPFYIYNPGDSRPHFMLTSSPVSTGEADIAVTIMEYK